MAFLMTSPSCRCTFGEKSLAAADGAPAARPDTATKAVQSAAASRFGVIDALSEFAIWPGR
jgi:hypothetical protein